MGDDLGYVDFAELAFSLFGVQEIPVREAHRFRTGIYTDMNGVEGTGAGKDLHANFPLLRIDLRSSSEQWWVPFSPGGGRAEDGPQWRLRRCFHRCGYVGVFTGAHARRQLSGQDRGEAPSHEPSQPDPRHCNLVDASSSPREHSRVVVEHSRALVEPSRALASPSSSPYRGVHE
jgi:hypothetical protein